VRTCLSEDQVSAGRKLSAALAEGRRAKGLSIAAVATGSGLAVDTVKRIESAAALAPTFLTVAAIAGVLDLSLDDLSARTREDKD
jgi:transcriptional regulator with XRE-family HTH domain